MPARGRHRREPLWLLAATVAVLIWSGYRPYERVTWLLEVAPVLIGAAILIATYRRFPLTPLAYRLIFLHAVILMVGGHYTYSRVPLGDWFADLFGLARNHYDRLGHIAQGFVPAILAREILLRRSPLRRGKWLVWIVCAVCLAISAAYEFLEWWTALIGGGAAEDFLATQGDVWDTQWDMFLALSGAVAAQLLLARRHDRELAALRPGPMDAADLASVAEPLEDLSIERAAPPLEPDVAALAAGLDRHATGSVDRPGFEAVGFFVRGPAGSVVAGVTGHVNWNWLHVKLLWVSDEVRDRGLGGRLLETIEAEAADRGCQHVHLDTFSYQAPDFYRRAGYREFARLEDYPAGSERIFMSKRLRQEAATPDAG